MTIDVFSAGTCRAIGWFMNRMATFKSVTVPVGIALLHHPTEGLILFDTGLHPRCLTLSHWSQWLAHQLIRFQTTDADTVVNWLVGKGISPSAIRYIIVSHYHNDHMGGLLDFPQARLIASRTEYERLRALSSFQQSRAAFNAALLPPDFEQRLLAVEDMPTVELTELTRFGVVNEVFSGMYLVNLPGHTRVQYGAYLPNEKTFLVADAFWTSASLAGPATEPPSIVKVIKDNWAAYRHTLQELAQFQAENPTVRLIAAHDKTVLA